MVMASIKSVCVYCGSSNRVDPRFLDAATELGRLMGEAGLKLIYGGGRVGLMGRVADGVLAAGGAWSASFRATCTSARSPTPASANCWSSTRCTSASS